MINLPTKFEVHIITHYRDMKCVAKSKKLGWFGLVRGHPRSFAMSPFDRVHMISYSSLIETMHLSCTVFELQQVICRNSPTSTYPTYIWRPCLGWPRLNFEKIFGIRKPESLGYHVVCIVLRLAVLVEHRLVKDRQTQGHGIYHAEHSLRGKNRGSGNGRK